MCQAAVVDDLIWDMLSSTLLRHVDLADSGSKWSRNEPYIIPRSK